MFAFGPVTDPALHRRENVPLDPGNAAEMRLRRPIAWLDSVRAPLHVFEGASGPVSNVEDLRDLQRASANPQVHFHPVRGANHFSVLAPTNRLIARRILEDAAPGAKPEASLVFAADELDAPFRR